MVRQTAQPPQTDPTPPTSQPLITPSAGALPTEMVLLLQQQQNQTNIAAELSRLSRENGVLTAEVDNIKTSIKALTDDVSGIKRQHHLFLGGAAVIGLALGVVGYFFAPKVAIMLQLADERQVHDLHVQDAPLETSQSDRAPAR